MPDIFELYKEAAKNPNENLANQEEQQSLQEKTIDDYGNEKGLSFDSNVTGNQEKDQAQVNKQHSAATMGAISSQHEVPLKNDPTTWTPEYTDRNFVEEVGTSLARGVGNHLIKGTGDLLQVAGGFINQDWVRGTMISRALQDMGEDMMGKFQSYLPEDMEAQNLTWKSLFDKRFWSVHAAEMIPQIVEFILLSKGGSSIAKKGAKGLLKGMPGAGRSAAGKAITGSGKGIGGALATDTGLTSLGAGLSGAVGGGAVGNLYAGMLNAAELVNTYKNETYINENGEEVPVYSDEELGAMASGTLKHNSTYMLLDMASWGMTFGGGWKALKGLNPFAKGTKTFNAVQQSKVASKMFAYDVAPAFKGLGRVLGKAGFEGTEEMYQESWEEWAKKKAYADATGTELEYENYLDFFASEENLPTKVLSFGIGGLTGGAFNIGSLINKKADDAYRLYDRAENFKRFKNKQGSEEELTWQNYHIEDTISDIVADGKTEYYDDFMNYLEQNENITPEERKVYDERKAEYEALNEQADRLNIKGKKALMFNHAMEQSGLQDLQKYQENTQANISEIQQMEDLNETEKAKLIQKEQATYKKQLDAVGKRIAIARQNKANLLLGKKATPIELSVEVDENNQKYLVAGLSTKQFLEYTKEGEKENTTINKLKYSDFGAKGKQIYESIVKGGSKLFETAKEKTEQVVDKVKETINPDEQAKFDEELSTLEEKYNATVTNTEQGYEAKANEGELSPEAQQEFDEAFKKAPQPKAETQTEEEAKPQPKEEVVETTPEQISELAKKIASKEKLTPEELKIRDAYKTEITRQMVKDKFGVDPEKDLVTQPNMIDIYNEKDFNDLQDKYDVKIKRTKDGIDVETKLEGKEKDALLEKINAEMIAYYNAYVTEEEDGSITDEESEYIKEESLKTRLERVGKDIAKVAKKGSEAIIKKYKETMSKPKGNEAEIIGGKDTRSDARVRDMNVAMAIMRDKFYKTVQDNIVNKNTEQVSQSELDNMLNSYDNYNAHGPTALNQMAVVNHHLKRMFPNTDNPVNIEIVENLYEAIGSIGVAHVMGSTIFIDAKVWKQDQHYMHEMSHIFYQLAKDEPVVQELVKKSLLNGELVKDIKNRYKDYTLYSRFFPGRGTENLTQAEILKQFNLSGLNEQQKDEIIKRLIDEGFIKTIPLSEQALLIEEMFVAQLQGPLSERFDKIFTPKNEPKRQKDVKKFWGLLRKKGAIIEDESGVTKMLQELYTADELKNIPDLETFIVDTFKAVTKGVKIDSYGLDSRAKESKREKSKRIEKIATEKNKQASNPIDSWFKQIKKNEDIDQDNQLDAYENAIDDNGVSFYDKSFDMKLKGARRVLRRFAAVYNKALKVNYLEKTKDDVTNREFAPIFNTLAFESFIFQLAGEHNSANAFIDAINESAIEEVQAFNRYLKKVFPDSYMTILNSMHTVLGNGKHVVGFRHSLKDGVYDMWNSLSKPENSQVQNILDELVKERGSNNEKNPSTPKWRNLERAINRIHSKNYENYDDDIFTILQTIVPFDIAPIMEQGFVTYKGMSIPVETLITGFIQANLAHNKDKNWKPGDNQTERSRPIRVWNDVKQVNIWNLRPIIEALVSTNRRFTPFSSVVNAENNLEPVRITNNQLTKEFDNMVEFMNTLKTKKLPKQTLNAKKYKKKVNGKEVPMTEYEIKKDKFIEHFSHTNYQTKNKYKTGYVHNQLLEHMFDQFMSTGMLPTISQYHGLQDLNNAKAVTYKKSISIDQGIEDFMTFLQTATSPYSKNRKNSYLGNIGTFADSPRKFFMNMKVIKWEDVFKKNSRGNYTLDTKGQILNSIYRIHAETFGDGVNNKGEMALTRSQFTKKFKQGIEDTIRFFEKNSNAIKDLDIAYENQQKKSMSEYFNKNGKLTYEGKKIVAEYAMSSMVNGYNVIDIFSPGIQDLKNQNNVIKRFKGNTSPIVSPKNPNFKMETMFFADEEINGSISGTDSAMYILEEDAIKWQRLGKGVFDLNHGFKFLNNSVEKQNSNFKHRTAYLKGYTTIVGKNHPLYASMKARKDKYNEWHKKEFGGDPSLDLSDGSFNHMVIAMPLSSDKSNFMEKHLPEDFREAFTEEALKDPNSESFKRLQKMQDDLHWNSGGNFVGLETYNFGPQQVMDKIHPKSNTPVQMINSIIVNAGINGNLEEAFEIQRLISQQKQINLERVVNQINNATPKQMKALIEAGLNKEDMDQAQRLIIEDKKGAINHPYVVEIVTNQLAKTLRRAGNKLNTPGTLSHQKPDSGWRTQAKGNEALRGYRQGYDGSGNKYTVAAEIVLSKRMGETNQLIPREHFTIDTMQERLDKWQKKHKGADIKLEDKLKKLELWALQRAKEKFNTETTSEAYKYVRQSKTEAGTPNGWYVKGEHVIASRVPGHGPASTGFFEVVGFHETEGNQVSVSSHFNDIIGSDNDGDALFIQRKANKRGDKKQFGDYSNWNEAFDKMQNLWLSEKMYEQITAKIDVEQAVAPFIEKFQKKKSKENRNHLPFSPLARMTDYDNTMVSQRNVGPAFNIHKITNMMAATNLPISKTIKINGVAVDSFHDTEQGINSRNHLSATLANIILDNAKYGYADDLGLNESNISQAFLMISLGFNIEQIGDVLTSKAAREWVDLNRNRDSMYFDGLSKREVYNKLMTKYKGSIATDLSFNFNDTLKNDSIIELLNYLGDMNAEVQAVGKILSGHKQIHVNPLVLEQQLNDYEKVINNKNENQTIEFNELFKSIPDLQNYHQVAKSTLEILKKVHPVYNGGTNEMLNDIVGKINEDLTIPQIEKLSKDIMLFQTSRLLGMNNITKDYAKNLLDKDPNNTDSIYYKLNNYIEQLRSKNYEGKNSNAQLGFSDLHNSVLFTQALDFKLQGTAKADKSITAKADFVGESFSKELRERARDEFENLPEDIRQDLILYDLLVNGWQGKKSLVPFFTQSTQDKINDMSSVTNSTKENTTLSKAVKRELELAIVTKFAEERNNPFFKIRTKSGAQLNDIINEINSKVKDTKGEETNVDKHKTLLRRLEEGKPTYINVIEQKKGANNKPYEARYLYEVQPFSEAEKTHINAQRPNQKRAVILQTALKNLKKVKSYEKLNNVNSELSHNINVATITDAITGQPHQEPKTTQKRESLDYLVEAGINYEETVKRLNKALANNGQFDMGFDARENFYIDTYTKPQPLTRGEYALAMEYNKYQSEKTKAGMYSEYEAQKTLANKKYEEIKDQIPSWTTEQALSAYEQYGGKDAYAWAIVMKPIMTKIAKDLIKDQSALHKDIRFDGNDISAFKAHMLTGSTIPANHPASQAMARELEAEYKNFIGEKRKYVSKMNEITDKLYRKHLGYGAEMSLTSLKLENIKNLFKALKTALFSNRTKIYDRLYGPLVHRTERLNKSGTLVIDYKLKTRQEVDEGFSQGIVSQEQLDFYNYFKETLETLKPKGVNELENYIPHTSMSKLEMFSSRGLLGLMANSRNDDEALYDVHLNYEGNKVNFKQIEDKFKMLSANPIHKNDINKMKEFRALKRKAKKLLKSGKNEDGTDIEVSEAFTETVLGFGAINRFANNRSIKSTELPSLDLNKALGDYIHSTLFVHGNEKFKGMSKMQGYIDSVLAFNDAHDLKNMNIHVQKVWKDYFLRGKRQETVLGKRADKVINALTRLNLFYALGYAGYKNTLGLYAVGNIMVGKYHNVKDIGGKAWVKGELRYWGLDKGLQGGYEGIIKRHRRTQRMLRNMNFMDINVYDEVNISKKSGIDAIFGEIALMPMIKSEEWIQRVHMLGLMNDEDFAKFDDEGNYINENDKISSYRVTELEDQVKASHGRGYQPTDQRAVQMYSMGRAYLQFSRFIPTMIQDRFARRDVNIYGKEHIGSLRAVGNMIRYVLNNPSDFVKYRNSLSEEQRKRLDSGLRGVAMSTVISMVGEVSDTANELFWDANYYINHPKLARKMIPASWQTTNNFIGQLF